MFFLRDSALVLFVPAQSRGPKSPTSLTREKGQAPSRRTWNSKSSSWKNLWQDWEMAMWTSAMADL